MEWTEVRTNFISTAGVRANWFEQAIWLFVTHGTATHGYKSRTWLIPVCFPWHISLVLDAVPLRQKDERKASLRPAWHSASTFSFLWIPLGDTFRHPFIHNPKAHLVSAPLASIHRDNLLPATADTRHFNLRFSRSGYAFVLHSQPAHTHTQLPWEVSAANRVLSEE